ncbi:MAG: bifunctional (p)ppGpp synthetase/guanosine-3',5'-bis(diphosphate) 3'-pyrophosphohydrolase [Desulfuromonas sp.]|nr:bifunctional (p)ppGpp synthetase/guanosine-3',5'-bis(diphosphate) 3'-pyrophosphohydrolase [Desulfuromonas sp.]
MTTAKHEREIQKLMTEITELLVTHHGGSLTEDALDDGIKMLHRGFDLAQTSHAEQRRKSGEPYLFHPLRVAHLAARYWMGFSSIIAALLHDVVEDTPVTIEEVEEAFGTEVALLVKGLTKVEDAELSREALKEETYRNHILVAIEDIRVLCLKLWDRIDNLRTIDALKPEKQALIAEETRKIYIPLARHLGMGRVAEELESLSLTVLYPRRASRYRRVLAGINKRSEPALRRVRTDITSEFSRHRLNVTLKDNWRSFSVEGALRIGRGVAALYSLEVLVDSTMDAYMALGLLHRMYQPITGKLRDHLNTPSQHGYQALKTTVQAGEYRLRIQITTRKLERFNEAGVLAPGFEFRKENFAGLMRSLLEGESVFDTERLRLASATIQVYTPHGESRMLPEGSSALDFAFDIHEKLGLYAFRARINGQTRLLKTPLMDGDQVRIETVDVPGVLPKWLDWAVTPKARNSIRRYLRSIVRENNHND